MSASLPISIPLAGLNTREPFIAFDSGYARELTNYAIQNGALQMRPGVQRIYQDALSTRSYWMSTNALPIVINSAFDRINLASGTNLGALDPATTGYQAMPTRVKHVSLDLVIGIGTPRNSINPFGAWGFTPIAITATAISSACSHKGRLYYCDGQTIEYSDVGQIAGAITVGNTFPVSRLMQGETVIRLFSVTALPGNYTSSIFVIFGNGGRVLVYQGDYPNSPSWELIGDFKMTEPISELGFVEVNGDIFVATSSYAYWFRDLFTADAETAYRNRPSKAIDNLWQTVLWGSSTLITDSHCFYLPFLNAVIAQCSQYTVDPPFNVEIAGYDNITCYFVYSLEYKAWSLWFSQPFFYPAIDMGLYVAGFNSDGGVVQYLNQAGWDDGQAILDPRINTTTSWKTPYYYPQAGKNRQLSGVKPYFRNQQNGQLSLIQAIYDLSDYNAPFGFYVQPTSADYPVSPENATNGDISVATNTTSIYTEFCGVSGNGAGVSIQFSQSTIDADVGNDLPQTIFTASMTLEEGANYPA